MESHDQYDNILMDIQDYCSNNQWSDILDPSYFFHADPIASVPADYYFPVQTCKSIKQFEELAPMFATHADTSCQYQKPSQRIGTEGDVPLKPLRSIDLEAFPADYNSRLMITPPKTAQIKNEDAVGRKRLDHVGYDEIRKYFRMPIAQAAREMNVGLIVLKKRCRELGITRWPHRKIQSLKSLIHNFQETRNDMSDAKTQHELAMLEAHCTLMEENSEVQLTKRIKKLRQEVNNAGFKRRRAAKQSGLQEAGGCKKAMRAARKQMD